jgi:hypothetical protein
MVNKSQVAEKLKENFTERASKRPQGTSQRGSHTETSICLSTKPANEGTGKARQ